MIDTTAPDVRSDIASYPASGERRRPSRPESVSPALLPLLRGTASTEGEGGEEWDLRRREFAAKSEFSDDLGTAKGVLVAILVAAAAWATAIWVLPALMGPFVT